jgi:hypothetical protein
MSMMDGVMCFIFALQLLLFSIWLPMRCQLLLTPWSRSEHETADRLQRRRLASLANLLLLGSGIVLLMLSMTGWLTQPVTIMFIFTALQVLFVVAMRQWLPVAVTLPPKRKASLQRRSVLDFISPLERLLAMIALFGVPSLSVIMLQSGLWTKDTAQLWQLCAVSLLANLCLIVAIYGAVFWQKPYSQKAMAELALPSELHIQHKVNRYLKAIIALNLLLMSILLLGYFRTQPEVFYISISLLLQLMLLRRPSEISTA